jgi:hypothetical protein
MTETVQTVIAKFAKSIIDEVKASCMLGEVDFRTGLCQHHVKARVKAIRRLREAGFTHKQISTAMQMNVKSVDYWLCARERQKQLALRQRRYVAQRSGASA